MKHTALRFLIASLLILVLCLPLFACDSSKTPEDTTAAPADGSETPAPRSPRGDRRGVRMLGHADDGQ